MRLWTIQPEEVYEQILRDGKYILDEDKSSNCKDFNQAYSWLKKQMDIKGIKNDNNLLWAWHTFNGKHHKPDLRYSAYDTRGTKSVCLELEIPDERVLLSDYNAWHYVLNDSYLDMSTNEEEWNKERDWFDHLPFDERQKVKEESWQRIFDTTYFKNDWVSKGVYVQATFYGLELNDIKRVQHFICK